MTAHANAHLHFIDMLERLQMLMTRICADKFSMNFLESQS
jgi:hypothetical protein